MKVGSLEKLLSPEHVVVLSNDVPSLKAYTCFVLPFLFSKDTLMFVPRVYVPPHAIGDESELEVSMIDLESSLTAALPIIVAPTSNVRLRGGL